MKLDETALISAIEKEEALAYGALNGNLAEERAEAMNLYYGRPYGDEIDGRSQIVSTDVADVIEWVMPSLVKVFCSTDDVVMFNPRHAEDVEQAEQETEYINYILSQKNNSFLFFYQWFKDALLQKNGYIKAVWEETDDVTKERYYGLSDDEFAMLSQDPEIEAEEHSEYPDPDNEALAMQAQQMGMQFQPLMMHDVVVRRTRKCAGVKVYNIPPEEVLVSTTARDIRLSESSFVQHRTHKTLSDIRLMGYDVEDNINDGDDLTGSYESLSRDDNDEFQANLDDNGDPSTRRVLLRETYMRIDQDGDGIAELRRILHIGREVLDNTEIEEIPIVSITPIIMSHRHIGRSYVELIKDLQEIKTMIMRQALDNMYFLNNGRYGVSNRVNLDDMMSPRPGGLVRIDADQVGNDIVPLTPPNLGQAAFPLLEYIDSVRENRTGITKYNQGMDANSLNKTMGGITQIMNASQQRIELVSRSFAETGVKTLFLLVHALTQRHQKKAEIVRLRNKWVTVDPREWVKRVDMTVSVGLGTGNKDQMLQHLMMILQAQKEAALSGSGLATPKNMYHALTKLTENAGFKNPEEFWTDPSANPQPKQPSPQEREAQAKLQLEQQKMQIDQQSKAQSLQLEQSKAQQDMQLNQVKLQHEMQLEQMKAEASAAIEREKMLLQAQLEREKMGMQQDMALFNHQSNKEMQGLPQFHQTMSDLMSGMQQSMAEALENTKQEVVVHLTQPKRIDRDPKTGKAMAVNGRPIERDNKGRMIGF